MHIPAAIISRGVATAALAKSGEQPNRMGGSQAPRNTWSACESPFHPKVILD